MKFKYIILFWFGEPHAILLPDKLNHDQALHPDMKDTVVSAGYCERIDGEWKCSGGSLGLSKINLPEDPAILESIFSLTQKSKSP